MLRSLDTPFLVGAGRGVRKEGRFCADRLLGLDTQYITELSESLPERISLSARTRSAMRERAKVGYPLEGQDYKVDLSV